jgi:histidinol-phosphatase (PHP family)
MLLDSHVHSLYSFDGSESIDKLCETAVSRKIDIITISDHTEVMEDSVFDDAAKSRFNDISADIEAAREKYGNSLTILFGCELGQPHHNPEFARNVLKSFDFDFIIGSLHYLRRSIDIYFVEYTRENMKYWLDKYFDEISEMVDTGGFNSLGHLDYILRRMDRCFDGVPTFKGYEYIIEEIFIKLAKLDIALEVNTLGLRRTPGRIGLEPWVLELYAKSGGKYITVGSDAHKTEHVGLGLNNAADLIKNTGFNSITYYKDKKPFFISI